MKPTLTIQSLVPKIVVEYYRLNIAVEQRSRTRSESSFTVINISTNLGSAEIIDNAGWRGTPSTGCGRVIQ